jgi:hypothetical protein
MATPRTPRKRPVDEKDRRALALRRAGYSFDAIAADLHCTAEQAENRFERAALALRIPYSTALELDRLDRMHAIAWKKMSEGDLDAMDKVLRIAERRDRLQAEPTTNDHAMRLKFEGSIEAARKADLVTSLDEGLVAAGLAIADRIDEALASGEGQEITKALYLVPHMMNVLRDALATPAARRAAGITHHDAESGKGARLRGLRGGAAQKTAG